MQIIHILCHHCNLRPRPAIAAIARCAAFSGDPSAGEDEDVVGSKNISLQLLKVLHGAFKYPLDFRAK